jgi:hypothetical protein
MPPPEKITPDTPLRLEIAAAIAFPDGSMTASGLRREAGRERLIIERSAGKDFTTLRYIEEMRQKCRDQVREPDCGSNPQPTHPTAGFAGTPIGSFEMDRAKSARAALHKIARAPSAPSENTSPANTSPTEGGAVIPLKS